MVGPLTIELAQKAPIFTGYLPIRISQLPLKLPPFTPQEIRGVKKSVFGQLNARKPSSLDSF
jgi:hypothetical protein